MAKIVVIGAGIGGMATAARLAKAGHTVAIYEASDRVGGKCRTEWIGDYAFDTGPSLMTLPAVYRDLFLKTGKRLEHVMKLIPVEPAFSYHFADGESVIFPNLALHRVYEEIERSFGSQAADEWHRLMQRAEHMWDVARGPFIESELKSMLDLAKRKNFLQDLKMIAPFTSLRKLTSRYTTNPYLTQIIDRYATYSGSDPRKVPAVLLTIAFIESSFGAWHIEGGIGKLATYLQERLASLDVPVYLNTPVAKILQDGSKATGIALANGETVEANIVVANADAEFVYNKLLPTDLKATRSERANLAKSEKSFSGFSIFLGLDNQKIDHAPPQMHHHNIFFPQNYDNEFNQLFDAKQPVADPTIYVCAPQDPQMVRGENKEAWSVLINAPRHDPEHGHDWSKGGAEYAKQIIAKMDALGLEVSSRLDVMEFRTPLDLQNQVSAPGGSIYGTSSNSPRAAFQRAKNRSPLQGLYCVGGSAHPGGGLPLVGMSAEIVAEAIGKP